MQSTENLPTSNETAAFFEFRFRTLEAVKYKDITQYNQLAPTKSFTIIVSTTSSNCLYCNENHIIYVTSSVILVQIKDKGIYKIIIDVLMS